MGIVCIIPVLIGVCFSVYLASVFLRGRRNRYTQIDSRNTNAFSYLAISCALAVILYLLLPRSHDGELTSGDIYRMLLLALLTCASPGIVLLGGELIQQMWNDEDE